MIGQEALLDLVRRASDGRIRGFNPGQWAAIARILEPASRLLLVQRTGWGKSLVYFAATLALRRQGEGAALVVCPLLSLMRDQLRMAAQCGLAAAAIHSENRQTWDSTLAALQSGRIDILYISPERLGAAQFVARHLAPWSRHVALLVVDEAHCISDWGHDFRPDYRRLHGFLAAHLPPGCRLLATTATAGQRVIEDVAGQLGRGLEVMRGPLARPSLGLQTLRLPSKAHRYAWLARHLPRLPGSGIVYAATRREAESLAAWLAAAGVQAAAYHAGMADRDLRGQLEQALQDNRIKALVATTALGMGFDKPDLAFVAHLQAPPSVVHYYQQVGRAGRALDSAFGILLGGDEDDELHSWFRQQAFPEDWQFRRVVEAVEDAEAGGITAEEVAVGADIELDKVERVLRILGAAEDPAVVAEGERWCATLRPWQVDRAAVEEVSARRRREWQRMQDYMTSRACLMEFLTTELDDPAPGRCGRCANCTGRPLLPPRVDGRLVRRAARHLAERRLLRRSARPPNLLWTALKALFGRA